MNLTIYYKDSEKPREIKGVNKFTFDAMLYWLDYGIAVPYEIWKRRIKHDKTILSKND